MKKTRCPSYKTLIHKASSHNHLTRCPNQMADVQNRFRNLVTKIDHTRPSDQMASRCPNLKIFQTSGNCKMARSQSQSILNQMSEISKKWFSKNQMSGSSSRYLQCFDP